jgi:hypothetical protein
MKIEKATLLRGAWSQISQNANDGLPTVVFELFMTGLSLYS